jgi:hypothetical protein
MTVMTALSISANTRLPPVLGTTQVFRTTAEKRQIDTLTPSRRYPDGSGELGNRPVLDHYPLPNDPQEYTAIAPRSVPKIYTRPITSVRVVIAFPTATLLTRFSLNRHRPAHQSRPNRD